MKKILAIALPIILIIAAIALLYIFVLQDVFDPPPNKVMEQAIEAARAFASSHTESNQNDFVSMFSDRSREGLEREWNSLALDGSPRGSWYDMATGLLNDDGSRPEVVGIISGAGAEGGEEGEEEEEAEEGSELEAVVRIRRNTRGTGLAGEEHDIPFIREEGEWRINVPIHPSPWTGVSAVPGG